MKVVLLAGGLGTRLSEETHLRPKPMVEIGNMPVLWHIMKIYHAHGLSDFVICGGYKCDFIKSYFANYALQTSDVVIDLESHSVTTLKSRTENWKITIVDTGLHTLTGGRIKRVEEYLGGETFCLTYGDGVGNVDITSLITQHKSHGKLATVTAAKPPGRFGALKIGPDNRVEDFIEKPMGDNSYINAGFFVLEPEVISYIDGDKTSWESQPLENIARDGQLYSFKHDGFWHPMDTLRDKNYLDKLYQNDEALWKVW